MREREREDMGEEERKGEVGKESRENVCYKRSKRI